MAPRHMKTWAWLLVLAAGLPLLDVFAPISDSLDKILSWVWLAIVLSYLCAYWWENRRGKQKKDQSSSAAISSSDQT